MLFRSAEAGFEAHSRVREVKAECATALKSGMRVVESRGEGARLEEGQLMVRAGFLVLVSEAEARKEKEETVWRREEK